VDLEKATQWSQVIMDDGQENRLREQLERSGRVAIRVPVKVQKKGEPAEIAWFLAHLETDSDLHQGEARFIRQGINITQANPRLDRDVRGLVVVRDPILSELLGDAEPPAHDKWDPRSLKFKGKYQTGRAVIRFVKKSLQELYHRVSISADKKDTKLLQDIFYVDRDELLDDPVKKKKKKPEDTDPNPDPPTPSKPNPLEVTQISGTPKGFKVASASKEAPAGATIEVAYNVRRGSALKNYHKFDFELGKHGVKVESTGCTTTCNSNRIDVEVTSPDFEVRVTGFDENRDLFVKAVPVRGEG